MPIPFAPPPPAVAPAAQKLPPLSFAGFRAGLPLAAAKDLISTSGGKLDCKSSSDPRMRECTGSIQFPSLDQPFEILISAVNDSAAVIILTGYPTQVTVTAWVTALTQVFGVPKNEPKPGGGGSWQWIRRGQMMRVIERAAHGALQAVINLTDGPLLDGLGPPQRKRPD
jgi:hypothetical protein